MARQCEVENCTQPVFGTDKVTRIGYCKSHQYLRTDLKKPDPSGKPRDRTINKVSHKQSIKNREYGKVREEFFSIPRNQICLAKLLRVERPGCTGKATEAHHSEHREGENFTDIKKLKGLCSVCHPYFETHPAEARVAGITNSKFGSEDKN